MKKWILIQLQKQMEAYIRTVLIYLFLSKSSRNENEIVSIIAQRTVSIENDWCW